MIIIYCELLVRVLRVVVYVLERLAMRFNHISVEAMVIESWALFLLELDY